MIVHGLRMNGMNNPVGFAFNPPICSWKVSGTNAERQVFARISVSNDPDFRETVYQKEGEDLRSSGEALDLILKPRTRYHLRVRVTTDTGEVAESTEYAYFETGKMGEPWTARWIKPTESDPFHPVFHKDFSLDGKVVKARLYITGLGLYEAVVNGVRIGEERLTPYYSDYRTECQYQTFDVTELLAERNQLEVLLGNGWFKGRFGLGGRKENFGSEFGMMAELILTYPNGSEKIIPTDETWEYRGSDIEESDIYDGEILNRLLWEGRDNTFRNAVPAVQDHAGAVLRERYSLPVRAQEHMPVREILHTPAGETVLDFGQNFAGVVGFLAGFEKGTCITLDFGEILQEGNFYNANYRSAKSRFIYVSDGRSEWVEPRFTFFGFRFVRVTGWVGILQGEDFLGKALYSDLEPAGWIETGHAGVNQLFSNTLWGQKSNSIDFPTDCPQRDERLGWTGDAQVFAGTASYNMRTSAFFHKFLHDLRTEQAKLDGILPGVIPVFDSGRAIYSSVWGDIATFLPSVIFEHDGDLYALERHYPMMKDWVDRITRDDRARGQRFLFSFGDQLGDWLSQDGRTPQSMQGGTDEYFIGSCYYAESVRKTADAAHVLGKTEDEVEYRALYMQIHEAISKEYFTESGRLGVDTQTGYVVSLHMGIYKDRNKVVEGLHNRLYKDCFLLTGGFVGAPLLCRTLAENGMAEEAFHFLLQEDFPGWMHCIGLGATTIWERWNSVLDDGRMSGTMMNSLNHFAYGAVVEFLYRDVAGIRAVEPGFRKAEIAPLLDRRLKHFKASYDSVNGMYRSEWHIRADGWVEILIEIPFGCSAVIRLPSHPESWLLEKGPGIHEFKYQPTEDLRGLYTRKTLFGDMLGNPEAMTVIANISPMLHHMLESGDKGFLRENLESIPRMGFLGFTNDVVSALTEKLMAL